MPNLGPGVPNDVNPAVTPQLVFTPTPGTQASVRLYNTGNANGVYVGGPGVTQYTGLPLLPGNRPIELQNIAQSLYAVSGVTSPVIRGTVGAAGGGTAGSTILTLSAAVPAGLAAGTYVLVGNTANTGGLQPQLVASTTASSQITFANPLVYDVAGGDVVYSATFQPAQLRVTAGVG